MTDKKNIYQRLNAVMQEVDYIQKDEKKVAGQYRFVSHDQVTAKLHGPMTQHGIACIPSIVDMRQEGNRTEVKLEVSFVNIDEPADRFSVVFWGYGIDTSDKGVGKAVSYAFKYAILKTFCLETGDDPDQDQNVVHQPGEKKTAKGDQKFIDDSLKILQDMYKDKFPDIEAYIESYMNACKATKLQALQKYMAPGSSLIAHVEQWKGREKKAA